MHGSRNSDSLSTHSLLIVRAPLSKGEVLIREVPRGPKGCGFFYILYMEMRMRGIDGAGEVQRRRTLHVFCASSWQLAE